MNDSEGGRAVSYIISSCSLCFTATFRSTPVTRPPLDPGYRPLQELREIFPPGARHLVPSSSPVWPANLCLCCSDRQHSCSSQTRIPASQKLELSWAESEDKSKRSLQVWLGSQGNQFSFLMRGTTSVGLILERSLTRAEQTSSEWARSGAERWTRDWEGGRRPGTARAAPGTWWCSSDTLTVSRPPHWYLLLGEDQHGQLTLLLLSKATLGNKEILILSPSSSVILRSDNNSWDLFSAPPASQILSQTV